MHFHCCLEINRSLISCLVVIINIVLDWKIPVFFIAQIYNMHQIWSKILIHCNLSWSRKSKLERQWKPARRKCDKEQKVQMLSVQSSNSFLKQRNVENVKGIVHPKIKPSPRPHAIPNLIFFFLCNTKVDSHWHFCNWSQWLFSTIWWSTFFKRYS